MDGPHLWDSGEAPHLWEDPAEEHGRLFGPAPSPTSNPADEMAAEVRLMQGHLSEKRRAANAGLREEAERLAKAGQLALLYRCYGVDGALLYVGKTTEGFRRTLAHMEKGWFQREAAWMSFERVPADRINDREAQVIRTERPRYNINENRR